MVKTEQDIAAILEKREQGQLLLSEEEGKRFLRLMGINVPENVSVCDLDAAMQAACKLNFPVVVKGMVEGITHKSDHGLVQVGISNEGEMESCYSQMVEKCRKLGKKWKILIEQQENGALETVVGLTTDANFGKVLMFGLGGIFVEILKDVSFKLCPINRSDAKDMVESLQASKLFKGARGQKSVDTDKIVDFLLSIGGESGIVGKYGDIIDVIEINPAIINRSGTITALDAVVRFSAAATPPECKNAIEPVDMERLFNPQTMGVVGISPDKSSFAREFLASSLKMGYKGRVFPINIKHGGKEVLGWHIYERIGSVPEDIDYLYISVPAAAVPDLLKEGKGKIRFAHIITSEFW